MSAPEIIQSKGHGKAVDWWALGILIYEMIAGYPPFYDENPFGIYQKILAGRIEFPKHFDPYAKDLVKKLLTADRSKRFGCLKEGADDIKRHRWFKGVDWGRVHARRVKPPYVPGFASADDTSQAPTFRGISAVTVSHYVAFCSLTPLAHSRVLCTGNFDRSASQDVPYPESIRCVRAQ
jgi:serine/threonine protein kinase